MTNHCASVAYVSVQQSFKQQMTVEELSNYAAFHWAIAVAKLSSVDRVVAVYNRKSIAAWELRGAYPSSVATYSKGRGDSRPRTALDLGAPMPVLPEYDDAIPPTMRSGIVVVEGVPVEPIEFWRTVPSGVNASGEGESEYDDRDAENAD